MAPIGRGVRGGGGVDIVFQPPLSFIQRQSGAFGRKLRNLEDLWDRFSPLMEELEMEVWSTEGFGEWDPLLESTWAKKTTSQAMYESGDLFFSLTEEDEARDSGPQHMAWGSVVEYAQYHQEGTEFMPAREVIPDPFPVEWRRRFEEAQVEYVNAAARETWGLI